MSYDGIEENEQSELTEYGKGFEKGLDEAEGRNQELISKMKEVLSAWMNGKSDLIKSEVVMELIKRADTALRAKPSTKGLREEYRGR